MKEIKESKMGIVANIGRMLNEFILGEWRSGGEGSVRNLLSTK